MGLAEDIAKAILESEAPAARYAALSKSHNMLSLMAVSAVAALVVRPTTTAALEIRNQNAGKVMVIDRLFSHNLVTSTTGLGGGAAIWAAVGQQTVAITDAALAISSINGKSAEIQTVASAASTTVADRGWFPYGSTRIKESAGAVVPGGILEAAIEGRIRVPYGHSLCLHVVSGYTGDTFCSGAAWYWEDE